jgi:hypothetical protein
MQMCNEEPDAVVPQVWFCGGMAGDCHVYLRVVLYRYRYNTTNIIEGLNRQLGKVTKTKSSFTNDTSLEKMLYLASLNVLKKWTQRYRNWDMVLSQLSLLYEDRFSTTSVRF